MTFDIERGLFKFDFTDYHAILGVPLDAAANDIRKRYLKISRRLHPDACASESEANKQRASQLFAKLVNPAYEQLFSDQSRIEHNALLGRIGKRLLQERDKVKLQSESANKLNHSNNLDHEYKTAIQTLAEKEYESLDQVLERIAEISELNTVYLMRKNKGEAPVAPPPPSVSSSPKPSASSNGNGSAPPAEKKEKQEAVSPTEPYCRRAEEYIAKNSFAKAVLELKDALKLEPTNSRCHALLGMAYLKQSQPTAAKAHIARALQLNPQEATALEGKKILEKLAQRKAEPQKKQPEKTGGGFFGLFGGKKK